MHVYAILNSQSPFLLSHPPLLVLQALQQPHHREPFIIDVPLSNISHKYLWTLSIMLSHNNQGQARIPLLQLFILMHADDHVTS
jgi:hypothetical protein